MSAALAIAYGMIPYSFDRPQSSKEPTVKTVVAYTCIGDVFDYGIEFYLVDGDHRHLNGLYSGQAITAASPEKEKMLDLLRQLNKMLYDDDGGISHEEIGPDRAANEIRQGAHLIQCGLILETR